MARKEGSRKEVLHFVLDDSRISMLEDHLKDFDPDVRQEALTKLSAAAESGDVAVLPERNVVNMHCHSFFSYNAYGYSPSSLAWLAKRRGFKACGIVDFDVLDGVDEFLGACDQLGVRGSAGIETRVFVPGFSSREINSPGEPGVVYHMGIGFGSGEIPAEVADIALDLRRRAQRRNEGIVARVNSYLSPVEIDYENDVLPLAPGGTPTERHVVFAYIRAAERTAEDAQGFWADRLAMPRSKIAELMNDGARFQNTVRKKLMKRGGVGYVEPGPNTFPTIENLNRLATACGALPCATWLDGTSEGEQAIVELLDLLIASGIVALNIIPDRNWNIADPTLRKLKIANLYAVVDLAHKLALPLNIGTEMNSPGQKLVDDLDAPELGRVRQAFLDGAFFIYGHTLLARNTSLGYQSTWGQASFLTRRDRNDFYTKVGRLVPPGRSGKPLLSTFDESMSPDQILSVLSA